MWSRVYFWHWHPSKGLLYVAVLRRVTECLAGDAELPDLSPLPSGPSVRHVRLAVRVGHGLRGAVFGVVQVESVADITEEPGWRFVDNLSTGF
jgi:hypothetical protein